MRPAWSKIARGVWLAKVDVRGTILSLMVGGCRGSWSWSVSTNEPLAYHGAGSGCGTQAEAFAEATSAAIAARARLEADALELEALRDDGDRFDSDPAQRPALARVRELERLERLRAHGLAPFPGGASCSFGGDS